MDMAQGLNAVTATQLHMTITWLSHDTEYLTTTRATPP